MDSNIILPQFIGPKYVTGVLSDVNSPFTFPQWLERVNHITPVQELQQYNDYLTEWYLSRRDIKNKNINVLRERFLFFIKHIQIFFSQETVLKWYNNINFNDERDLLIAIPYFAKKLKEIALYYTELRDTVKGSKLKANLKGTDVGITESTRQKLLKSFSKKEHNAPVTIPLDVWKCIPELSSINLNLDVEVVNLYDDSNYFDTSTEYAQLTSLTLIDNIESLAFLESKGLLLSASDWLHTTTFSVSTINDDTLPSTRRALLGDLASQLLAEDKYTITYNAPQYPTETFLHKFITGENFFYWPVGPFKRSIITRYLSVALSACGLDQVGTPGDTFDNSDVIFVKKADHTEGAWLTLYTHTTTVSVMQVLVNGENELAFRFPYPGFGLTATDITWTGPCLSSQPEFVFMTDEEKYVVENAYWDYNDTQLGCVPLKIDDSTLYKRSAASSKYTYADKVKTWGSLPSVTAAQYSGEVNEAWLYKFTHTEIPISTISDTAIVWPYGTVDTFYDLPSTLPDLCKSICEPVHISQLIQPGMTASSHVSSADIIYQVSNYRDDSYGHIVEGAWLFGETKIGNNFTYIAQPGLNMKALPNRYTKFVWDGDPTPISKVFVNISHATDCVFFSKNLTFKQFSECNCKQVYFASFGHGGAVYDEHNRQADFIALVDAVTDVFTVHNLNEYTGSTMSLSSWRGNSDINLGVWRGSDGLDYTQSVDFSWYKTPVNCGGSWGDGEWSNDFILQPGNCYCYYRTCFTDTSPDQQEVPFLRKIYDYSPCKNFIKDSLKWVSVLKDSDGTWTKDSGIDSNLTLYAGTFLRYVHSSINTFFVGAPTLTKVEKQLNVNSKWSNYDEITIDNSHRVILALPNPTVILPPEQTPPFDLLKVSNVKWTINSPDGTKKVFKNSLIATFVPDIIGVYKVILDVEVLNNSEIITVVSTVTDGNTVADYTAIEIAPTRQYTFTGVPSITAISPYVQDNLTLESVALSTCGFVLRTPLFGWDYSAQVYDGNSFGARPFWGKSYYDYSTGSVRCNRRFDVELNGITQPEFSDIVFHYGQYIDLENTCNRTFEWLQPIVLIRNEMSVRWNKLIFNSSDFCDCALSVVASATHIPSDIVFESVYLNESVEVFYIARQDFAWSLTVTPIDAEGTPSSLSLDVFLYTYQPWLNILNRFNPTIATYPFVGKLYSIDDIGEYFTPTKLGVTSYTGPDVTYTLCATSGIISNNQLYCVDGTRLDGSRESRSFNIISENSNWIKEPTTSQTAAGNINKSLHKTNQKFVPYQSFYESCNNYTLGVIQPNTIQTPWIGENWSDSSVQFTNLPQIVNVDEWKKSQVLLLQNLQLENWCTDIFNNQYCLYKKQDNDYGSIWIRTQGGQVLPASTGLSSIFSSYQNIHESINFESGVKSISIAVDTLVIELSNAIFFEKLYYDYSHDIIFSSFTDSKLITLSPIGFNINKISNSISNASKLSAPWYNNNTQKILLAICNIEEECQIVKVFEYDISNVSLRMVFTINLNSEVSDIIKTVSTVCLDYNSTKKIINVTLQCKDEDEGNIILSLTITDDITPTLYKAVLLNSRTTPSAIPTINTPLQHTLHLSALSSSPFQLELTLTDNTSFSTHLLDNVNAQLANNTITLTSADVGVNYIPFYITLQSNSIIYNALTVNIIT